MPRLLSDTSRSVGLLALVLSLTACGAADRIANIGRAPELTPIQSPVTQPEYTPVRMPMPAPRVSEPQANSLWQPGSRAFFRDNRAGEIGDILTVVIEIDDEASLDNSSSRSRTSAESAGLDSFLGIESHLDKVLPEAVDPTSLIDAGAGSSHKGEGQITRKEKVELKIAVVVNQLLPNGNMVIYGRQEVRVNFEARDLEIAGVVRPSDITPDNTISYEKIAEARISYGGRGQITDVQQPRYGQQLYDIVFPF